MAMHDYQIDPACCIRQQKKFMKQQDYDPASVRQKRIWNYTVRSYGCRIEAKISRGISMTNVFQTVQRKI